MNEPADMTGVAALDDTHRDLGARLFNRTWELLDRDQRSPEEEEEMLSATLGQRYHWYRVGTPLNMAIADWQVSRVAAVLGFADLADRFGRLSRELCERHHLDPFYRAYAHEAIARAAAVGNDRPTRDQHALAARELLAQIRNEEQRAMVAADVAVFLP